MKEDTRSKFLFKNLLRGLIWFAVIIVVFLLIEDYITENFQHYIEATQREPFLFYGIFMTSEILFGLIPPEFFMLIWILNKITIGEYILGLAILTVLSYLSGVIGFHIGRNFSKTHLFGKIREQFMLTYEAKIKSYGGFLVFVGAVTPVPFSATCMLAGSVGYPYKNFILISLVRVVRFALYGWMVWSFPNLFS